MVHMVGAAAAGFVVGCFCPGIVRKVRSWFSKENAAVSQAAQNVAKKL